MIYRPIYRVSWTDRRGKQYHSQGRFVTLVDAYRVAVEGRMRGDQGKPRIWIQ